MSFSHIAPWAPRQAHVRLTPEKGLVFDRLAVKIVIMDRSGRILWKKERDESLEPIRWDGIDLFGCKVGSGSLICKIMFAHQPVVYVPFVFIQK